MRNICLVIAVVLALPFSANAEQRPAGGRNSGNQRSEQRGADERRGGDRRQSDQRQSDQRQPDQQQAARQQQVPTTGLGPIGLPPARPAQLPSWEQRQTPAWEKRQVPAWEQRQTPYWEKQSTPFWEGRPLPTWENPTRAAQSLYQQPVRGHHVNGKQRRHYKYPPVYYVLPSYGYYTGTTFGYGVSSSTSYVTPTAPPVYEAPLPETGVLQLDVEPRQALQIFVDGLYIGTLADLGEDIELRLGARRIELRAPGYRTLIFDTEIVPDRIVVYRGALDRLPEAPAVSRPPEARTPAAQAPQAPGSRTMYLIPGCYLGNVEPTAGMLRPGCDLSKLTTIVPQ